MASPHVAGTAALIMAAGIRDGNNNGRINDEIRVALQSTAQDLGPEGVDTFYGYGMAQPEKAIASLTSVVASPENTTTETSPKTNQDPSVAPTPTPAAPPANLPAPALRHIPITPPGLRR